MKLSRRFQSTLAAGLLAASTVASSVAAQSVTAQPQTAKVDLAKTAVDLSKIAIDNFGQINPNYYRGAQPRGHDYADLAALGVKTDIDLTSGGDPDEGATAAGAGLKFVRIPMTTHDVPTADQIAQFLKIVTDPASQPVYVHCQGGRHRTGIMTAIYRIAEDHWTGERAFAEMKQYRFGAEFLHSEFASFVREYPAQLARASAAQPATAVAAKAGS